MSNCVFFSCRENATKHAHFYSETSGKKLEVVGMVCDLHDRYTRSGGELSLLFRRSLAREEASRYPVTPPTLPGSGAPPQKES